jgi:hypothetical protein
VENIATISIVQRFAVAVQLYNSRGAVVKVASGYMMNKNQFIGLWKCGGVLVRLFLRVCINVYSELFFAIADNGARLLVSRHGTEAKVNHLSKL